MPGYLKKTPCQNTVFEIAPRKLRPPGPDPYDSQYVVIHIPYGSEMRLVPSTSMHGGRPSLYGHMSLRQMSQ